MCFINRTIKSAFMKRTSMRNNCLKNRSDNDKRAYDKHKLLYVTFKKNSKELYKNYTIQT